MGICKLCQKEKVLIEAHIVPKWAYKYLYPEIPDGDNRALILVGKDKKPLRRPIGPYDPDILCEECDGFLGKYDQYAKGILLDSPFEERGEEAYLIKNVDFDKLRVFLISVLWRAGISNRTEYEKFSIGPYEERIRNILLNVQQGVSGPNINDFSFIIGVYQVGELPKNTVDKNIQLPIRQRFDGVNTSIFYFPRGLKVFIKTDRRDFIGYIKKLADYTQEGLIIAKLGNYSESFEFTSLLEVMKNQK